MKKALIYGLSAALLLASLTACNKPQADQQNTEPNPTQAATSTPAPEEPTTPPEPETSTAPTSQTPAAPEQLSNTTQAAPDENEASQPPEETEPQEPAETDPFSPVEETVYATGTVNIRSGPSTDTEKVGSLSRGQSVTRTGVGTGDYAKWSRVELEDGRVVYIASSYLSTTKPTTQSTSGGTTQTTKPGGSTGSQDTTQTQPSGSTGGSTTAPGVWDQAFYNTLTPEQQAIYSNGNDLLRSQMKQNIEAERIREAEGWHSGEDLTPEELRDSWSGITVGS